MAFDFMGRGRGANHFRPCPGPRVRARARSTTHEGPRCHSGRGGKRRPRVLPVARPSARPRLVLDHGQPGGRPPRCLRRRAPSDADPSAPPLLHPQERRPADASSTDRGDSSPQPPDASMTRPIPRRRGKTTPLRTTVLTPPTSLGRCGHRCAVVLGARPYDVQPGVSTGIHRRPTMGVAAQPEGARRIASGPPHRIGGEDHGQHRHRASRDRVRTPA